MVDVQLNGETMKKKIGFTRKDVQAVVAENRAWNAGKPRRLHRSTSSAKIRKSMQREARRLLKDRIDRDGQPEGQRITIGKNLKRGADGFEARQ